jgi:competence protein ComEC
MQCLASGGKMNRPEKGTAPGNPVCKTEEGGRPDPTENAKSIVLRLQYGRFTFLDGADLTWDKEAQLVCPINRVGTVDLFQIDHHGLDLSSNPVLLKSICPRVVVVNNGPEKGPEPNCVNTLRGLPCVETVWQPHRNLQTGPELNTDPQFIANNEVKCKARFIEAMVQADGTFSVQIGQTGTRKEYRPR